MDGRAASLNCASTAGPEICITCPMFSIEVQFQVVSYDFQDLSFEYRRQNSRSLTSLTLLLANWTLETRNVKLASQSGGAAHNLNDLARNLRLTNTVHAQSQSVNHLRSVVAGGIHCGHAGSMLSGY